MNFFKFIFRTAGQAVKGAEHIATLSDQVSGHLSEAQLAIELAQEIASDHQDHTGKVVSNLQSMITDALDENARVQAAAKTLTATKDAITAIVNPTKP